MVKCGHTQIIDFVMEIAAFEISSFRNVTTLTLLLSTGEFGVCADFGALGTMLFVAVTFVWSSSFSISPSSTNFWRSTAASSLLSIQLCLPTKICPKNVFFLWFLKLKLFNLIGMSNVHRQNYKIVYFPKQRMTKLGWKKINDDIVWIDQMVKVIMGLWRFNISLFFFLYFFFLCANFLTFHWPFHIPCVPIVPYTCKESHFELWYN